MRLMRALPPAAPASASEASARTAVTASRPSVAVSRSSVSGPAPTSIPSMRTCAVAPRSTSTVADTWIAWGSAFGSVNSRSSASSIGPSAVPATARRAPAVSTSGRRSPPRMTGPDGDGCPSSCALTPMTSPVTVR